jgi:hypothetical protein
VVILETSEPPEDVDNENVTDLWIVANIYNSQTAVLGALEIQQTNGRLDFGRGDSAWSRTRRAPETIRHIAEATSTDEMALNGSYIVK